MITLNCDRIEPAAQKKDKERLIAGLTIGRRTLQLKCKFCFVCQSSFADKFFRFMRFFFRHEQRVSLRLPLSVLADVMERLSLTPVYGKRQTANSCPRPLSSVFSSLYSRMKIFVFAVNSKRHFSIFV